MSKKDIIVLKEQGLSNREVSRRTGHDRKTVSKYWEEYRRKISELSAPEADLRAVQEDLLSKPKYKKRRGRKRKYTEELDERLREIVKSEARKEGLFGARHKQSLTNQQIHEKLISEGFDISRATINIELAKIRNRKKEVFIRQEYDLG